MQINVNSSQGIYPIIYKRGSLQNVDKYVDLNRKVMIITDEGVPKQYIDILKTQCKAPHLIVVKQGESSKSFETYKHCIEIMLEESFYRSDLVIALGGGVVGDLAGFVAASYMRGVDFVNIPTTTLAQIDSSIGGKVAINVNDYKNSVGAFWQPKTVIIDLNVLDTLSERHYNEGLAEAIKHGLIKDKELFELFEKGNVKQNIDEIIYRSLLIKKSIVEEDEKETGIRKILNFGHTIGHAYESYYGLKDYYHGECVGMGMIKILEDEKIRERLKKILLNLNLPIENDADPIKVYEYALKDKKASQHSITVVQVNTIGNAILKEISLEDLKGLC
ncbi:MAG: 3-dehydroquinate synthase [Erysipelotrichaceae bacterium]|nr:3-dehydroquinate synthase [Erysipelotrichaceae bacterium]